MSINFEGLDNRLTVVENKTAYPYITTFKKEPFKSFALMKRKDIGHFYFSEYERVVKVYKYYNENLLKDKILNLENIYWFLLLRKYLREDKQEHSDEIYDFIIKCEVILGDKIGFKFSPSSKQKYPDIWSTYFALASLKLLGALKVYLSPKGKLNVRKAILEFIDSHKTGHGYLHCLDKDCPIDKKTSVVRTLYFILDALILLGVDVRANKEEFSEIIGDLKKDPTIVFKLLCSKFIETDINIRDKEIQYLYSYQRENKGFSFKKVEGQINTTFWVVYALNNYSWILDYNPMGIYSFINAKFQDILVAELNPIKLMELSKLAILFSIIWEKFIQEIERVLFKQLEQEKYVDLNQIKNTFGLVHGIEEVISFINLNYTFNLRILDNRVEFKNFIRNLGKGLQSIAREFYDRLSNNSIVSLSDISKRYKSSYYPENVKLREDVLPMIRDLARRNFFKGTIRSKRKPIKKKYLFYLNFFLEKIIVSDTEINLEQLLSEKEKLKDHKNTIYNMILKLKTATNKTREEIESYLLIDEIDIAKERIRYLIHNTLMDAEFLNENIELSFSEDLYYINLQKALEPEINAWKKQYSVLKSKLRDLELNLQARIEEKEEIRSITKILNSLKEKISNIEVDIHNKIEKFRSYFRETLETEYSDEIFNLLTREFEKISQRVQRYDNIIYRVSQQIQTREGKLKRKHKKIIDKWITIKQEFDEIFGYYTDGFEFFHKSINEIEEIRNTIRIEFSEIGKKINQQIAENEYEIKIILDAIKKETDAILSEKMNKIKDLQKTFKKEIKSKQKLYLLYRYLPEKLDALEEDILELMAQQVQLLKNKALEERKRAKTEDFDNFVNQEMANLKTKTISFNNYLNQLKSIRIKDVNKGVEKLQKQLEEANQLYKAKLNEGIAEISDFEEKSNVTIIQWENFKVYFYNEIENLKNERINTIITNKIKAVSLEKKTNNIDINELKKELNLNCKVLLTRIREMIEISQISAKLYEDKKCLLLHTDHFYKNEDLKNHIDNKILKPNNEAIGKILALYDSSIKNKTLGINTLELKNRIQDLRDFEKFSKEQFSKKIEELEIDRTRSDYKRTKKYFKETLENQSKALKNIKDSLIFFIETKDFIFKEFNKLSVDLKQNFENIAEDKEKIDEDFQGKVKRFDLKHRDIIEKIEIELKESLSKNYEIGKLNPEIREFYVQTKNEFQREYENKIEKLKEQVFNIKNDSFREDFLNYLNENKIQLSQLLGNLERSVEDDVEVKFYKRAYLKIDKRVKRIENEIKDKTKSLKNYVKKATKKSKDFETRNKYLIDDFGQFLQKFWEILGEKVKQLEQLIIKSYIETTINAVANGFLTTSFLNEELKIKKKNIQEAIIILISNGELEGKYDIRLGIYYEDPEILNNINEEELEVIKKMPFKFYMFITHLKSFTGQYASIIAMFASVLTITYTLFAITGNLFIALIPFTVIIILLSYAWYKKKKEAKIKI
ncbi:MAG: hypothetical protein JW891_17775 [Candidatus Lokiarchaeota archaeon]|nr:hypothetical protein [Candidatus Lokiarchaeota archaeon]